MKHSLLALLILFASKTFAQNNTEWMNPKPFSGSPRSVCFIDEKTGWIAGLNSEIVKTTDFGKNWNAQLAPSGDYEKVYFFTADQGWLLGKKKNRKGGLVAYTNNGGKTWIDVWSDNGELYGFGDIDVRNERVVYICGGQGVFKTINNGKTWENLTGVSQNTVQFINDNVGFTGNSDGEILKTINGGISWQMVAKIPPGSINKIRFVNNNIGYAIGYKYKYNYARYTKGLILKTIDSGDTWEIVDSSDNDNSNFTDIAFQDKEPFDVLAIDSNGKNYFYRPTNKSWSDLHDYSGTPIHYYGAYCFNNKFYIVGESIVRSGRKEYITPIFLNGESVYRYDEYGYTNNRFSVATKSRLNQVNFINDDIGWIAGDDGTLLKTTNAGQNWENIHLFSFDLKYVSCQSSSSVYAASTNKLIHSADGGKNWSLIQSPKLENICGINFFNENNGVVFRGLNKVLRTYDGGNNWIELPIRLTSILFFNNKTWWGVYNNMEADDYDEAFLYKTNDGGINWSDTIKFDINIRGISFIDDKNGWLNESRSIRRTYDGGKTWKTIYQAENEDYIASFYAISKNLGFMLKGRWGENSFYVTHDGGFSFQPIKENLYVNNLFYGSNNYGWGIGERGSVMRINHSSFQTNK